MPTASNADLFYAYMKGWHCGAGLRMLDPKLSEHADEQIKMAYLDGWAAGRKASGTAGRKAEKLYGYAPSIIRLMDIESE